MLDLNWCLWLATTLLFYGISSVLNLLGCGPYLALENSHLSSDKFYRIFTYSLIHQDSLHLFENLSLQILAGSTLIFSRFHSCWIFAKVFLIFLFGIYFAGFGATLEETSLQGASGGVYALIGANWYYLVMTIANFLLTRIYKCENLKKDLLILIISMSPFVSFCINDAQTSHEAHVTGIIAGFFLSGILFIYHDLKDWSLVESSETMVHIFHKLTITLFLAIFVTSIVYIKAKNKLT